MLPRPDLILLDLNLPKKDGREVLEEIKGSEAQVYFRSYPDYLCIRGGYSAELSAHAIITVTSPKPVALEGFLTVVRSIDSFWLSIVVAA